MLKINLVDIVVGSTLFLVFYIVQGIPVLGIGFFLICNEVVFVNRKLKISLNKIDKNLNSYQYLKAFDGWLKEQLSVNRRMARLYYLLFFLTAVPGIWFSHYGQEAFNIYYQNPMA